MGNSGSHGAWTSLVEQTAKETMKPLPEELRPLDLKDYVGQEHLSDQLQTLFNSPRLPSLLLFGPPGCGKSSLAPISTQSIFCASAPRKSVCSSSENKYRASTSSFLMKCTDFQRRSRTFSCPFWKAEKSPLLRQQRKIPLFP